MLSSSTTATATCAAVAIVLVAAGELVERFVFFASVPPSRMPGTRS